MPGNRYMWGTELTSVHDDQLEDRVKIEDEFSVRPIKVEEDIDSSHEDSISILDNNAFESNSYDSNSFEDDIAGTSNEMNHNSGTYERLKRIMIRPFNYENNSTNDPQNNPRKGNSNKRIIRAENSFSEVPSKKRKTRGREVENSQIKSGSKLMKNYRKKKIISDGQCNPCALVYNSLFDKDGNYTSITDAKEKIYNGILRNPVSLDLEELESCFLESIGTENEKLSCAMFGLAIIFDKTLKTNSKSSASSKPTKYFNFEALKQFSETERIAVLPDGSEVDLVECLSDRDNFVISSANSDKIVSRLTTAVLHKLFDDYLYSMIFTGSPKPQKFIFIGNSFVNLLTDLICSGLKGESNITVKSDEINRISNIIKDVITNYFDRWRKSNKTCNIEDQLTSYKERIDKYKKFARNLE